MRAHRYNAPARFASALLFGGLTLSSGIASAKPPAGFETRAIWVVKHALSTPGRVDRVVEVATEMHANTILAQVRGRGDAYYKSDIAPPGEDIGGAPAGFDPLDRLIQRAHAAGLEVHAWINVYLVWSAGAPPTSPLHVVNAHPEWISVRADGTRLVEMVPLEFQEERIEGMFLAPGNPAVKRHLREIVKEIVTRYAVDGIHLDYVRYPEPTVGYDAATRTEFERQFGVDPLQIDNPDSTTLAVVGADRLPDLRAKWIQWKRDQVTDLVRTLRADLNLQGRPIKLTAAVIADENAALNRYLQEWPTWLREGIIDAALPMTYSPTTSTVVRQLTEALEIPTHRQVWAGIAVYNEGSRDAAEKMRRARALGVDGIALFSYDTLLESASYRRNIRNWLWRAPTMPTPMPWREKP
ncbi:MAG: glycoside hydrolase family 10 protein [Bacteroidota bacterium]